MTPPFDSQRRFALRWAAVLGLTGVALGAFAAHALREVLPPRALEAFTTATRYQLLHAVALLALAGVPLRARWVARLWVVGVGLFAGSIYLIAVAGWRWLGPVTPVGGVCLMLGWGLLLLAALKGETHAR